MNTFPTLQTARLILRAIRVADAGAIQRLAGDRAVAATTLRIPHPYEDGMAEQWIATLEPAALDGTHLALAITRREEDKLIGAIGLTFHRANDSAELGYWIGRPYWDQGYATEAAQALVRHGFESLALNRIYAHHFIHNPASGRVLRKAGLRYEGRMIQAVKKWNEYVDIELYAVVCTEYRLRNAECK